MRTLVLISSSPALPGDRSLPPPTAEFTAFFATAEVDWSDAGSVTEYTVAFARMLAGAERPFDEAAMRELVRWDIEPTRSRPRACWRSTGQATVSTETTGRRSRGPSPSTRPEAQPLA